MGAERGNQGIFVIYGHGGTAAILFLAALLFVSPLSGCRPSREVQEKNASGDEAPVVSEVSASSVTPEEFFPQGIVVFDSYLLAGENDGQILRISKKPFFGEPTVIVEHPVDWSSPVESLQLDPTGRYLATLLREKGYHDGRLYVVDLKIGEVHSEIAGERFWSDMVWISTGQDSCLVVVEKWIASHLPSPAIVCSSSGFHEAEFHLSPEEPSETEGIFRLYAIEDIVSPSAYPNRFLVLARSTWRPYSFSLWLYELEEDQVDFVWKSMLPSEIEAVEAIGRFGSGWLVFARERSGESRLFLVDHDGELHDGSHLEALLGNPRVFIEMAKALGPVIDW